MDAHGTIIGAGFELAIPALVAFSASLLVCLGLVLTQRLHGRFTHDHHSGPQKFHLDPTPRIGGIGIALGYLAVWFVLPVHLRGIWMVIGLAGIAPLAAGLAEDLTRQVGVKVRLIATMGGGLMFAFLSGYLMDKVDLWGMDWLLAFPVVAYLFTAFAMGGVANAINIIDGFNGLAAGSLIIMFGAFGWVAYQVGDDLVFGLALLFAALVLGFFIVNFPTGRIFLGDGGAYFCGFLLAALGVLLPARNVEISAWTAILICAYPVIETLASMRRKARREGHSVGQPDRVHFHMLAHRRYARRIVRQPRRKKMRNPVTAAVTWVLPLMTTLFVMASYQSAFLSACFFFLTAFLYDQIYKVMSLNGGRLKLGLARLL
jgi:UDP-N-acetylmuramyl pentapeptide phosphotransferase/UDP-N-acetylglucosamine-1-phosphate transferase